ncbi:MAG: DPP IV N-terminal domain-containing protein, partial [Bacteroidota bacterium]
MKNLALLLAFALIFASPMLGQKKGTPISLGNIWLTYDYYPAAPQGFKFMNDDRYYSAIEKGVGIVKYSVETGEKVETVVAIPGISSDFSYEFSGDEKAYFSKSNIEPIYRHSTRESVSASYLDGKNGAALAEGLLVSNATFCPTDNNKIAFVYENNVVLREVSPMKITQVTQGGNAGKIIHGMPDWVYEEEFGFADALKWSPSGKYLAFYTTDESRVKMWNMPLYPGENYTMSYDFKYPKAGEDNSIVSISIYNVETGKTVTADVGTETDQYIPRIKWNQDGSQLAVMRLNRLQNQLDVLMVDPETGSSQTILTEKSETYIAEATDDKWHFLKSGEGFLWLSEESGYKHIYHYDMSGKKIGAITSGEWEVEKLLGVDEDSETVYYTSTEVSPLERHLYKVKLNGKGKKQLTTEAGTHSITASPNMTYFMDTYSN